LDVLVTGDSNLDDGSMPVARLNKLVSVFVTA
jgi:hypothetical protein